MTTLNTEELDRVGVAFRMGLHAMVAVLVAVAFALDGPRWHGAVFVTLYLVGMVTHGTRQRGIVVVFLAIAASWAWFTWASPAAVYIVFALFFLAMALLPVVAGVATVVVLAGLAVGLIGAEEGLTPGGVLGPVIAASVAVALSLGVTLLRRESAAREEASLRAGEMEERTRVAAEIHDTIAQGLSSIVMLMQSAQQQLEAGNSREASSNVDLARRTAQDNLAETRRIISKLQAADLEANDLPAALAKVCAATPMGDRIRFQLDGEAVALPRETEHELVRVTQSLVSNVVRHSQAKRATVTLSYLAGAVALDVVDNGVGLPPREMRRFTRGDAAPAGAAGKGRRTGSAASGPARAVGLAGVARRVAALGGSMHIESESAEAGTDGTDYARAAPVSAGFGAPVSGAEADVGSGEEAGQHGGGMGVSIHIPINSARPLNPTNRIN